MELAQGIGAQLVNRLVIRVSARGFDFQRHLDRFLAAPPIDIQYSHGRADGEPAAGMSPTGKLVIRATVRQQVQTQYIHSLFVQMAGHATQMIDRSVLIENVAEGIDRAESAVESGGLYSKVRHVGGYNVRP